MFACDNLLEAMMLAERLLDQMRDAMIPIVLASNIDLLTYHMGPVPEKIPAS
jgi:hypothetical protein